MVGEAAALSNVGAEFVNAATSIEKSAGAVFPPHVVEKVPEKPLSLEIPSIKQPEGDNWEGRNEKIGRGRFAFKEDFQRNGESD